jgi:protein-tyrosine phosphatase
LIREIYSDRLFLGNAMDARDLRLLYDHRLFAVVDLAVDEPPAQLSRDMVYCRFPLNDGGGNANEIIDAAIRSIVALVDSQIRTLVACSAGMSRSLAIAAAALAMHTGKTPDVCLTSIAASGPHDVSPILWSQVIEVYNHIVGGSS